jgi:hypothetical protein
MLRALTAAQTAGKSFALLLAAAYVLLPIGAHLAGVEHDYFLQTAAIAAVGALFVFLGSRIGLLDGIRLPSLGVKFDSFLVAVWGSFLLFVLVACVTAERIPALAALQGADPDTLVVLRERFLKAREGWQSSFVYVNAVLAGALVPYSLALMLLHRHRYRWLCFGFFLIYCLSFVEKVFFLKAAIPLAYLVFQRRIVSVIRPVALIGGAVGVLALVTALSGVGSTADRDGSDDYFSTSYVAQSPLQFIGWRAVVIPVVSAADTLRVFEEEYRGKPMMGATSALLAAPLGVEKVNLEREVFAAQWGQNETETGNTNSVYLTEAYVNFGYAGVVAFSLVVGLILRLFARSEDEAFRSLWMLFCFALFVGPLTGTLFSNGFALVILISLAVRFEVPGVPAQAEAPA